MNDPDEGARQARIVGATRLWLEKAVIGLNLCPFAKAVRNRLRYTVSSARTPQALLDDLIGELQLLRDADPAQIETTLLIHPDVLGEFLEYNDFLDVADDAVAELGLAGVIQVASFHPHYRFEGTEPEDIGNYSNRSPYPMLHLLREASVERAVTSFPDVAAIPERNIDTLKRLGREGWANLGLDPPPEMPRKVAK